MKNKQAATIAVISILVSLAVGGIVYFAHATGGPYTPGQTLDPGCNPGDANCIVNFPSSSYTGVSSDGANGLTIVGNVAAGSGTYTATFSPQHTMTYSPQFDTSSYKNFRSSIYAGFFNNGTEVGTDSAAPNYNPSITPDAGFTVATFVQSGNNWGIEVPSASSPSSLTAAYGNGFVMQWMANGSTTLTSMGDGVTNLGTNTALGASSTHPMGLTSTSSSTSGSAAGWQGNAVVWPSGYPVASFYSSFSASADYSSNARIWFGFCHGCTASNLNSDTPNLAMAMIRYSTVAGDTSFQCVTSDGASSTVVPITGATPSTTGALKSITINANSVVCTIGSASATVTATLPTANASTMAFSAVNITQAAAATHIQLNGVYTYYQSRNNVSVRRLPIDAAD
jgi:hypothetical protein